jgi:hypothetical protein
VTPVGCRVSYGSTDPSDTEVIMTIARFQLLVLLIGALSVITAALLALTSYQYPFGLACCLLAFACAGAVSALWVVQQGWIR